MAEIRLITSNFKNAYSGLNGTERVDMSQLEMMWSSVTLGFQRTSQALHPRSMLHRIGLGLSAISYLDSTNNQWHIDQSYGDLDPSEKTSMSYWQGMIFAKIVAWRKLRIRHLIHADRVMGDASDPKNIVELLDGKKKGDFVGQDGAGNWHVLEAKGRSGPFEKNLVKNAKKQAKNLVFHAVGQPRTKSVCATSLKENPITVYFRDPPVKSGGSNNGARDLSRFWSEYYGSLARYISKMKKLDTSLYFYPFLKEKLINEIGNFDEVTFAPLALNPEGMIPGLFPDRLWDPLIYIGLPREIVNEPANAGRLFSIQEKITTELKPSNENYFVGPDLVYLISI